ncbi:MAG TPA: hypothetical protein VLT84_11820 [Acidobacteriota bacterium]|nr:hypothetical protein [Acidobacteriota bacterium]
MAALGALSAAWRSYTRDERRARDRLEGGIQGVLDGLRHELNLAGVWARGPDGEGYPPHGDEAATHEHYRNDPRFHEWLIPLRGVRPLTREAIGALGSSEYAAYLGPLLGPFALLNSAMVAIEKAERERAQFVTADPRLLAGLHPAWVREGVPLTQEQLDYVGVVFLYNFALHVQIIGSRQSADANCLFQANAAARREFDAFEATWRDALPRPPRWHLIADAVSVAMLVAAVAVSCSWLWKMLDPLPRLICWLLCHGGAS